MKVEDEMDGGNSFLDATLGELALFKAVAHARPAGAHRYFHIISIRQRIKETAGSEVSIEDLWKKIGSYWHLDAVESNELLEGDINDPDVSSPPLPSILEDDVPTPLNYGTVPPSTQYTSLNLNSHPHFRTEFELPYADFYALIAARRLSRTIEEASTHGGSELPDESEEEKPLATAAPRRSQSHSNVAGPSSSAAPAKAKKTQMEGLFGGGDSDSSELTQPDDDEESTYSARRSVMTNKDDDDDDELNILAGPVPGARRKREQTSDSLISKAGGTKKGSGTSGKASKPAAATTSKKKRKVAVTILCEQCRSRLAVGRRVYDKSL
ncbi:hypothetical protein BS47DRAFT_1390069 [Hydnum rufescens UP504]|uniref:Uncharacterized protein n=1 Tax=Hydnum rufescens UP504 TaxID=1448309 RepID=A0A9P6B424_9AGAM|nr:hypothetical protein BS47DRAFT_1390069 [Hydnum rufescens UP504]